MWKTSFLGWALASMLILTGSASADSFTFTSAGSVTWNGVYVNPYSANDNTQIQNNPLTIYCDDWNTDFSGTPTWNANVYQLTLGNTSHFKYGNTTPEYNVTLDTVHNTLGVTSVPLVLPTDSFKRYLEAAWLDDQWQNILTAAAIAHTTPDADAQRKIAAAVWTLFVDPTHVGSPPSDPTTGLVGAINSSGYATAVNTYLVAAQTAVAGGYLAPGWDVIIPTGNTFAMQEFLVHGFSGDTVPEPSAVILLGTVIGYLGLTKFRRKRQA
jgi:hypothetical protein